MRLNKRQIIAIAVAWASLWTYLIATTLASEYVTFSGGVMTVTQQGATAGMDAVQSGIAMAFGILAFLGIYALALWGKFVLNFVMSLPNKVFWWGGWGK